jgi:hypothetical protein
VTHLVPDQRVRWIWVCLVVGVHVLGLIAVKLMDRLSLHYQGGPPPMILLAPRMPVARLAEPRFTPPSPSLSRPTAPLIPLPEVVVGQPPAGQIQRAPEIPSKGLDLSVHPDAGPNMEKLLPSASERQRQFFKDQAREDALLNRTVPSQDHSCEIFGTPEDRLPIPTSNGIAKLHIPGFSVSVGGDSPDDGSPAKKPCL